MQTITVIFDEHLHHVCLMAGLKQTFGRMPFLNRKVLEIGERTVIMNNAVAPPPVVRNPKRTSRLRKIRNIVDVSYWRERLSIEYDADRCSNEDITIFVDTLIQDYLQFRHPFMKTFNEDGKILESASRHQIAEIII